MPIQASSEMSTAMLLLPVPSVTPARVGDPPLGNVTGLGDTTELDDATVLGRVVVKFWLPALSRAALTGVVVPPALMVST